MMTFEWLNTCKDYYRINLIKHVISINMPVDIINIIILFVVQNLEIGDLVNAPINKNSSLWYRLRHRYKSKHKRERRSDYMHNCIIINTWSNGIIISYELHYIGWTKYTQWTKIEDIKPFIPYTWQTYDYKNLLELSIIKDTTFPVMLSEPVLYHHYIRKIVLFIQQDKKITKEIITTFPTKLPKYIYLCSDIQFNSILYLFVKIHPNGYR